jgi:hypothetical protein
MPHGWAIAEFWLLLRDCLVFEEDWRHRLVLLSGIPPGWFTHPDGIKIENMPIHSGNLDLTWKPRPGGATLELDRGDRMLFGRFVLRLPPSLNARVTAAGRTVPETAPGEFVLPFSRRGGEVEIDFER